MALQCVSGVRSVVKLAITPCGPFSLVWLGGPSEADAVAARAALRGAVPGADLGPVVLRVTGDYAAVGHMPADPETTAVASFLFG